ncbi:COP9 signalosome complex subunit 6 [Armadillidium nasatum]|uniref:COP9 signalosome complex subunit 6 n=2 Tax=Armadillidium nasatum TaxID=96803 RepID=A0A5N5SQX4_9CRUS|nr:COP9 signalosome complex subunit 6 [Armadillidium nasatum]
MSGMDVDEAMEEPQASSSTPLSLSKSEASDSIASTSKDTPGIGIKHPTSQPCEPSTSKPKEDCKTSIMAPAGTVGSVSISLHPLVILNISEHWTRQRAEEGTSVQVLGALIGKQNGRHIEIMNSFELAYDRVCDDIIINRDYYQLKEGQYVQVFSEMDILGWYTTGDVPNQSDINIHKQMCDLLDSPIFLKLNPLSRHSDQLPITVYESVVDVVEGAATLLLVELPYTLATEEAERIGIDHVARIHDSAESSLVGENLQAQYNAIKMLASRVHLIEEYVRATQKGEVPFNHEIIRQINALSHRLPVLSSPKFREEFYNQNNDVALMAYLGAITKCCNTMNKFINRFNQLHERFAIGRRMRGLFF